LTRLYRILRRKDAQDAFNGEGAFRYGGRWSSPGTRIVYASEHLSLAMVEYFVHLSVEEAPKDLVVAVAEAPDTVSRDVLRRLPANWNRTPAPSELSRIGDRFAQEAKCAALAVPCVLAPDESNWLLNPMHPDFKRIRLFPAKPFRYDSRFF
jgi:RES domain-containing protein